jgi:K+-transporting ATPase ATPase A chain
MTSIGVLQILLHFLAILLCAKPMGAFMAAVFDGRRTWLHPALRPLETLIYRVSGVRESAEQRWTQYAGALLAFSFVSFALLYLLQRVQAFLPLNPQGFGAAQVSPDLAFNTAVSFMSNTNWQAYAGESTLSYFVQMAGLTVQNFLSAAAGIAVATALIRGFARRETQSLGNFWVDLTRATVYVLLPLSLVTALFLCSQGTIQNWSAYVNAETVEGAAQTIAQGPVASQEAIKMLGTNGGGFFNANSAHPYENPTPLTNFVQMWLIFLIPAGLTYTFGRMAGDTRQGWALFAAMSVLVLAGAFVSYAAEAKGNPLLAQAGVEQTAPDAQPAGNLEVKRSDSASRRRRCSLRSPRARAVER